MRRDAAIASVTRASVAISIVFALAVFTPGAQAVSEFASLNGTVSGTAVHVIAGSNAFPNFATGAIDNRYPLAHAHVDGSPFSEGTASTADTGPLGATIAAEGQQQQPQYADSRYPPEGKPSEVGQEPGPRAVASAAEDVASAAATFAGTPPELAGDASSEARAASLDALNTALLAWRSDYMTAADAARYPFVAADADEADSVDGLTASSRARVDAAKGLVLTTDARLERAVLAGGAIQLIGLHAVLEITNAGTPKETARVDVADASIGGVPVLIGQDGVIVDTTELPGVVEGAAEASAALNEALVAAGFDIHALGPKVQRSQGQVTVTAAAAVVGWKQPPSAPGVPQQFVELRLGEAFGDALAMPEHASLGVPAVPGLPASAAIPSISGSTGAPAPEVQALPGVSAAARAKPAWLLAAYLAWQTIMAGTVVSLWRWRAEARAST